MMKLLELILLVSLMILNYLIKDFRMQFYQSKIDMVSGTLHILFYEIISKAKFRTAI